MAVFVRKRGTKMVKAEHVNPFILSVCKVVKDVCKMDIRE